MAKCSRYVLRIVAALMLLILFSLSTTPVFASIPQPTSLQIQEVVAYENTREDGDQLYLVKYYTVCNTTESADELFIFRLLDSGGDEISSAAPYPFYDSGYGLGVVAFYFEADEAPAWQSSLSVQIVGNPLADWDGDPPITTTSGITWNTDSTGDIQELTSAKIMYLAAELEQSWSVEMTTTTSGTTVLSDTGASYFLRVVPYLDEVAPYVLGIYTFTPEYPEESPAEDTYSTQLEEGIEGTIFDVSPSAKSLGISRGALTAAIYYAFVVGLFILLHSKHKFSKGTMLLLWPFVIAGHFIGVPLIVTILGGFLCIGSTVWVFYKGTA